jgi:protoporphyrinogen oxidase
MDKIIILGAGIAGLAAAHAARENGLDATVYEGRDRAGGLLDNIQIDGFVFDTAVHLSFATEPEVRAVFDKVPYFTHVPKSLNWDDRYWLKHPAQTNMSPLPTDQKVQLIAGLVEAPSGDIANYRDWLIQQYGRPIAERWPLVYTKKYWTVPAEALGTDWVGQRMRKADLKEILHGAFSDNTPNQYYVKEMRYPEHGGYRSFIESLIVEARIHYGKAVVGIDADARIASFADGSQVRFGQLISTIPLPNLIASMSSVPDDIRAAAQSLYATEIDLISVGFNRPNVSPALWFYIYDEDILASRAYSPDWKSPNNVPAGCSALQFEVYWSRERPRDRSIEDIKENTVYAIEKMGLASREEVRFVYHNHVPYANVVFDIGMEERRDKVLKWVEARGIVTAGRFGEWQYLWSNQSFMSGVRAVDRIRSKVD